VPPSVSVGNRILDRLSEKDRGAWLSVGREIDLNPGDVLHRFGGITAELAFPLSGIISLTMPTPEGQNVEVALVGREGVFGVNRVLGDAPDLEAIAQVKGTAITAPFQSVGPELLASLRGPIGPYVAGLVIELAQTAACNRLHSVEERTARWLLHAADRAETSDLNLTHEFMAMMLGVRRASVTVVVGGFEAAGLIETKRRRISVIDPDGLRELSCSCYDIIRRATTDGGSAESIQTPSR
jgi:CRP-like cAMP-binding protein